MAAVNKRVLQGFIGSLSGSGNGGRRKQKSTCVFRKRKWRARMNSSQRQIAKCGELVYCNCHTEVSKISKFSYTFRASAMVLRPAILSLATSAILKNPPATSDLGKP